MLSPRLGHGLLKGPAFSGTRLWSEGLETLGHHTLVAWSAERPRQHGFAGWQMGHGGEADAPQRVVAPCLAQQCLSRTTCPERCYAASLPTSQLQPPLQMARLYILKTYLCQISKCPKLSQKCWRVGEGERLGLVSSEAF